VGRAGGGAGFSGAAATGTDGGGNGDTSGTANTGGGGGGKQGLGGSGVVIIKYPATRSLTVGAGLTSSTTTSGDYKITTFTAGTDSVVFA